MALAFLCFQLSLLPLDAVVLGVNSFLILEPSGDGVLSSSALLSLSLGVDLVGLDLTASPSSVEVAEVVAEEVPSSGVDSLVIGGASKFPLFTSWWSLSVSMEICFLF